MIQYFGPTRRHFWANGVISVVNWIPSFAGGGAGSTAICGPLVAETRWVSSVMAAAVAAAMRTLVSGLALESYWIFLGGGERRERGGNEGGVGEGG